MERVFRTIIRGIFWNTISGIGGIFFEKNLGNVKDIPDITVAPGMTIFFGRERLLILGVMREYLSGWTP